MPEAATSAPPRAIQAAMDEVLTTHGSYIPVELLLALGRLRYTDYEAWRCGERPSLQSALAGNPRRVIALLEDAARWAGRLGLRPDPQSYHGWGANARQPLTFLDRQWCRYEPLLATHYVRTEAPEDGGQFDLFLDSGTTAALQDLRTALQARDPQAAERSLTALAASEPNHRLRPAAEQLTDALAHLSTPLPPQAASAELRAIEQSLLPAARDVLGAHARDLLAPFWQRLAIALADTAFDAERPTLHASYAYACCLDWPSTIAAIEDVPDHLSQPALLTRLADARHYNGDRNGAIAAWCRLCSRAPEIARMRLDDAALPDSGVRNAWLAFHDLELDSRPEPELFPAYLLLAEPGLARALAPDLADGDTAGDRAFRAMHRLVQTDDMDARRAVHDAAPWLLEIYLHARE